MKSFAIVLAAAGISISAPAVAQDAAPFTGPYIAAIAGFDRISADDGEGGSEAQNGLAYGANAGFDFGAANSSVRFGIEGEVAFSTIDACDAGFCVQADRDLYAGGRVGIVAAENAMVYVKGGYTNARAEAEAFGETEGQNLDGVRAGVGVEARPADTNLMVKIEYRYSNYELDVIRHQGVVAVGFRF